MIIAIIPAAGESRRMIDSSGQSRLKQLLPYGQSTVIESVIQTVCQSNIDQILVILGHQSRIIRPVINRYPVTILKNRNYKSGMLSSIQCGIRKAMKIIPDSGHTISDSSILIFLGDQPTVQKKTIDQLIKISRKSGQNILIPVYRKKRGHPVLIKAIYGREILKLSFKDGLRQLLRAHPEDILEIPVRDSLILKDIDTFEDYQIILRNKKKKS